MKMNREDLEITGGRKLYLYTFTDDADLDRKQAGFWGLVGDDWHQQAEAVEAWFAPVTLAMNEVIGAPGPQRGEDCTALDLGCGSGSMRLPNGWSVIGLDIARQMRPDVVSSCGSLPIRSESVDLVVSRFALMFAGDPVAAFWEAARVLRPGGRLVFSVWGSAEDNLWSHLGQQVCCRRLGLRMPGPDDPGAFRLADVDDVRGMLTEAGLEPGTPQTVETPYLNELQPADAVEGMAALAGPFRAALDRMTSAVREEAKAELIRLYEENDITGSAFVWLATRPR